MSIYEYDFEKHMRQEREESYEDGYQDGRQDGYQDGRTMGEKELLFSLIQKKLAKGKSISEIADELEESVENISALIRELL